MRGYGLRAFIFSVFAINSWIVLAGAQNVASQIDSSNQQTQQHREQAGQTNADMSAMDMPNMDMSKAEPNWMPSPADNSGTEWQPAVTPDHMWMKSVGAWDLMAHGVIFTDYNQQGGPRGEGKAESVNWLMLMEQHKLGHGNI
jgi:hypothetical protein